MRSDEAVDGGLSCMPHACMSSGALTSAWEWEGPAILDPTSGVCLPTDPCRPPVCVCWLLAEPQRNRI